MKPNFNPLTKHFGIQRQIHPKHLQLVGQIAGIGRKFKQFSGTNLKSWQWFLLLYVAGTGCLLVLVTFLKVAMKLI